MVDDSLVACQSRTEAYRGPWVAVGEADERVVADAASLAELHGVLAGREHPPVLIRRIPSLDDPIFVGLS